VSWARAPFTAAVTADEHRVTVRLTAERPTPLTKEVTFDQDGRIEVNYAWPDAAIPSDAWVAVELSLARAVGITCDPLEQRWSHAIATVAKSERGLEETEQGLSVTLRWPAALGGATALIDPYGYP
jgi:hypothetical protein